MTRFEDEVLIHKNVLPIKVFKMMVLVVVATQPSKAPRFRTQGDGSKSALLQARIRDTVDIYCPTYNSTLENDQAEYSAIYMVTKYGYENCVLDKPRQVGRCSNPSAHTVIKLTFRDFTPLPFGLEFKPGNTYYFVFNEVMVKKIRILKKYTCTLVFYNSVKSIATSNGSYQGLHNTQGGLCQNKNLRLKVQVESEQQGRQSGELPAPKNLFHNFSPFAYNAHPSPKVAPLPSHYTERQETLIKTIDNDEISIDENSHDRHGFTSNSNIVDHRRINSPKLDWKAVRDNNIQSDRSNNLELLNQENFETGSGYDNGNKERLILYEIHETYELDKSQSSKLTNSARPLRRTLIFCAIFLIRLLINSRL
uniref:Ephrin RBD domain-containing protein n=1 Tax=Romanomermis culicivorax TaxID=13658 RepID=A0A915ICZ2_ROMCU